VPGFFLFEIAPRLGVQLAKFLRARASTFRIYKSGSRKFMSRNQIDAYR
jgi:hypothetical protein